MNQERQSGAVCSQERTITGGSVHPGWVYVIETDAGIKIGWTRNPSERIAHHRRMLDEGLYVWALVEGSRDDERRLHLRYAHLNLHGEWFQASNEIMRDCESGRLGKPEGLSSFARSSRAREQVVTDFKPEPTPKRPPKGLRRTAGFRRNPTLASQFRFAVLHEFGGRCILADLHECAGPLDPAHLIPKATLRKLGLPETVVYDYRNGVAACRKAHRRNDDGLERFPRELLPPSVEEFAKAHGFTYLLDKLYERSTG